MKQSISIVLACLVLASCGKGKPKEAADASTANGPLIRVEGSQVLVNGEVSGSTRAIEDLGRMQKIDELFDRLKKDREVFKAANPSMPFPGRATLDMDGAAPAIVFKSVFQTAAFAGYPFLSVDTAAGDPVDLVTVNAIIPGPPGESEFLGRPHRTLHVRLEETTITLTEKKVAEQTQETKLDAPVSEADLREKVKRAVIDHFLRRDLRANPVPQVIVHSDNRLPFGKLAAAFRGLADAHERLAGPGNDDGAFVLCLAVN